MIDMSFPIRLVLAIFTSYRLAELFALDDGPIDIFRGLREYLGRKASVDRKNKLKKSMADLFNCPFCLGVWFSVGVSFLVLYPSFAGNIFILMMGIAGAQSILSSLSKRFME